ncbi:MAG TPA: hypothetical protein VGL72_04135 [Bryobacteraceae bacterium]
MTDWKTLAAARGLQLSDTELATLATVLDALEPAYQKLTANLTHEDEPAFILAEEVLRAR